MESLQKIHLRDKIIFEEPLGRIPKWDHQKTESMFITSSVKVIERLIESKIINEESKLDGVTSPKYFQYIRFYKAYKSLFDQFEFNVKVLNPVYLSEGFNKETVFIYGFFGYLKTSFKPERKYDFFMDFYNRFAKFSDDFEMNHNGKFLTSWNFNKYEKVFHN